MAPDIRGHFFYTNERVFWDGEAWSSKAGERPVCLRFPLPGFPKEKRAARWSTGSSRSMEEHCR